MAAARATQETYHEGVIHFIFRLTYIYIIKLFRFNYVIIIILQHYWHLLTYGIFILLRCEYVCKSAKACTGSALTP